MNRIADINQKNFYIKFVKLPGQHIVKIIGSIDIIDPEKVITPFFNEIDLFLTSNNIKNIFFDVCELKFVNSSGIKVILQFVMEVLKKPPANQYFINIIYNAKFKFQKSRFDSIYFLAPDIIKFKPV